MVFNVLPEYVRKDCRLIVNRKALTSTSRIYCSPGSLQTWYVYLLEFKDTS